MAGRTRTFSTVGVPNRQPCRLQTPETRATLVGDDAALETSRRRTRLRRRTLRELATMDGISSASRAVLVLHFQEEMSLPAVAAILEIPLGTVKSRLAYGLTAHTKATGSHRGVDDVART